MVSNKCLINDEQFIVISSAESATTTKILHVFFSSNFENKRTKSVPCQFLSQNSHGKFDYFNIVFRFSLSAITRFANGRERGKGLGLAETPGM